MHFPEAKKCGFGGSAPHELPTRKWVVGFSEALASRQMGSGQFDAAFALLLAGEPERSAPRSKQLQQIVRERDEMNVFAKRGDPKK